MAPASFGHSLVPVSTVVVEEQVSFTLASLSQATGADPAALHALVLEGLLQPTGLGPADWCFTGDALRQARLALRLAHELDMDWLGVALVMDLLAEVGRLRASLRRT